MITDNITPMQGGGQIAGPPGRSAYDVWVANGGTGNASVFLASLVGPPGAPGAASIVPGPSGGPGPAGPPAYASAVQWTQSLVCVASAPATVVTYNGLAYVCVVSHVSSVWNSDFSAGRWLQITTGGVPGATGGTGATGATGPTGPQPWQTPPYTWAASTTYSATAPAAIVVYNGACYVCITTHTSTSSFDSSKFALLAAAGPAASETPGKIAFFAMNSVPTGWFKANGANTYSRTTYSALFANIGTTWGTGDGSTTFGVPDLRGYFLRAFDDGRGVDSGRAFGSTQASQNLLHNHTVSGSAYIINSGGGGAANIGSGSYLNGGAMDQSGGSEARPVNIALLACIKY